MFELFLMGSHFRVLGSCSEFGSAFSGSWFEILRSGFALRGSGLQNPEPEARNMELRTEKPKSEHEPETEHSV
jgi:hypothetical protein